MSDPAGDTIAHYQKSVPYYTQAFDAAHSRHLDPFLELLESGARILELGCGTGRDAARMKARGFVVDATDGTPAMIAKAKERHGIEARLMRFDELDTDSEYDAVWAHACLMHVPRAQVPEIIGRVRRALVRAGLHHASFKRGDAEGVDERGRWNSFVPTDWIEQVYADAGFDRLETVEWEGEGADGVVRKWVSLTVRKG